MKEHGATQFEETKTRIVAKKPDGDILGAWSIDDDHGITGLGTNIQAEAVKDYPGKNWADKNANRKYIASLPAAPGTFAAQKKAGVFKDAMKKIKSDPRNQPGYKDPELSETLSKSASASDYVDDFVHSKNKMFKGDSKAQRVKRALGAYYSKKNEAVEFLADGKKDMKRKYLGKMRGRTATGKTAHAVDCDPSIDIKKKPGM
jgi:hypothetical protein